MWNDDEELFATIRQKLFTAVVGDVMDKLGLQHQFLPPSIRPLLDAMVVLGRAMPVLEIDSDTPPAKPFGLMLEALDSLRKGEVYFAAGGSPNYAMWGELMSTRAMQLGATGAVMVGYSRDTPQIRALGFPTFSMGSYAQDQAPRGHVADFRLAVQVGKVTIEPGDILFGDVDGVLVIPKKAETEVLTRALEKAEKENLVRTAIENGMSTVDAFATFGVM